MESINLRRYVRTSISGEHREGFCEKCRTPTQKEFYMDGERQRVRMVCPKCDGLGRLISRSVSIQAPAPPKCLRPKCLIKFVRDVFFCGLLSEYHRRRVAYAERHRHEKIPEKYRTGENSPLNIRQAIFAIIELRLRR